MNDLRRRAWLCLPPLVLCGCDVTLTLAGQPAVYWLGDRTAVREANPLGRWLLEYDPGLFVAGAAAWAASACAVVLLWRHPLAVGLAVGVTAGHACGAACWLALHGTAGWAAAGGLLIAAERLSSLSLSRSRPWAAATGGATLPRETTGG